MGGKGEEVKKGGEDSEQSPRWASASPAAASGERPILKKQMSAKANCLCSPTTHAGSFRCRHHRVSALRNSASVGTGLSDLVKKSSSVDGRLEVPIV